MGAVKQCNSCECEYSIECSLGVIVFFQAEDGIRDLVRSRGLGDVYKRQIVIFTHNMQQAARVSDYTAFFYLGDLIEMDKTDKIFTNPGNKRTEDYVTGRFG